MQRSLLLGALFVLGCHWLSAPDVLSAAPPDSTTEVELQRDLVGYWKLQGDCCDSSGRNNHGTNHGVDLQTGRFDGRSAYVEVPSHESLQLGQADFMISAWIHTDPIVDDTLGDVFSWYDPQARRGVTLNLNAGSWPACGRRRHQHRRRLLGRASHRALRRLRDRRSWLVQLVGPRSLLGSTERRDRVAA